jgi:hypothetical protein
MTATKTSARTSGRARPSSRPSGRKPLQVVQPERLADLVDRIPAGLDDDGAICTLKAHGCDLIDEVSGA